MVPLFNELKNAFEKKEPKQELNYKSSLVYKINFDRFIAFFVSRKVIGPSVYEIFHLLFKLYGSIKNAFIFYLSYPFSHFSISCVPSRGLLHQNARICVRTL